MTSREKLSAVRFSRLFTSPRRRARQACELLGLEGLAEIESNLAAWNYGDGEGRPRSAFSVMHFGHEPALVLWSAVSESRRNTLYRVRPTRMLFDKSGFHGWHAGALCEDIKFDNKHSADIERLAMITPRSRRRAAG